MAKARWEKLTEDGGEKTDRMRVEGGWLYRTRTVYSGGSSPALAFVPDTPIEVLPKDAEQEERRLHA